MSVHSHRGRVIPTCRTCRTEADLVIAYDNGDAHPHCFPCGNTALETGGREYPLEEYYTLRNRHCGQIDPHDSPIFELFDPDDEGNRAWICADNGHASGSSRDLAEWS